MLALLFERARRQNTGLAADGADSRAENHAVATQQPPVAVRRAATDFAICRICRLSARLINVSSYNALIETVLLKRESIAAGVN